MHQREPGMHLAEHEHPGQVDAVPQRREAGDPLQGRREVADREERAGEQEQRDHQQAVDHREAGLAPDGGRVGEEDAGEAQPDEHQHRPGEQHADGGREHAERRHHEQEHRGRGGDPEDHEREVRRDHVDDVERRGDLRVVGAVPLDVAHHGPRGLPRRGLHRLRGDQPGRHEREVGRRTLEVGAAAHEATEQHPHGEDVEQRHHERRDDRALPGAEVDRGPVGPQPGDHLPARDRVR